MKGIAILSIIGTLVFSSSYAACIHKQAIQDPYVKKILAQWDTHKNTDMNNQLLQNAQHRNADILNELKIKLSEINIDPAVKKVQLERLNKLIQKHAEMNFLNVRINEIIEMLESITTAAWKTSNAVTKMQELAIKSANDVISSDERNALNLQFQAYKRAIHFVQTIDLIAGEKIVSQGDINIQVGEEKTASSLLNIQLPSFTTKELMLDDLNISTVADAMVALQYIYPAIDWLSIVMVTLNTDRVKDAEAMLASIPSVLAQDYVLYLNSLDIIVLALNGTVSDSDRALLETYYDYIKDTMTKVQTYVSLGGPKMLGTGDIHIQIGKEKNPQTTLDLTLPITDIKLSGFEASVVTSYQDAYEALDTVLQNLHDLVYGNANQL